MNETGHALPANIKFVWRADIFIWSFIFFCCRLTFAHRQFFLALAFMARFWCHRVNGAAIYYPAGPRALSLSIPALQHHADRSFPSKRVLLP